MRLAYTVAHSIGGVWGAEPGGDDDLPVVRVADFDYPNLAINHPAPTSRSISASERATRLLVPGDILLEKSGGGQFTNVGRAVLWTAPDPAVCSNFVQLLRPAAGYEPRFLVYLHRALYVRGVAAACTKQNTGIQNLGVGQYLSTAVDVPPIESQVALADFLDLECDRIKNLSLALERLARTTAHLLKQWFLSTVTPAPRVPLRRWMTSIADGPFGSSLASIHYVADPGIRVIRLGDVGLAELRDAAPAYVDRRYAASALAQHRVAAGDLVMAGLGDANNPLGRAAVVTPAFAGAIHKADCYRIQIDDDQCDPQYVAWALSFGPARDAAPLLGRGSTRARLNTVVARELPVPHISREEQRAIVRSAVQKRKQHRAVTGQADLLRARLAEYRDALITEAVTGQLDVGAVSDAQMDERAHAAAEGAVAADRSPARVG